MCMQIPKPCILEAGECSACQRLRPAVAARSICRAFGAKAFSIARASKHTIISINVLVHEGQSRPVPATARPLPGSDGSLLWSQMSIAQVAKFGF